jgi:hypothetical protein
MSSVRSFFSNPAAKTAAGLKAATEAAMNMLGIALSKSTYTSLDDAKRAAETQQTIQARIDNAFGTPQVTTDTQVPAPKGIRDYIESRNKVNDIAALAAKAGKPMSLDLQRALQSAAELGVDVTDVSVIGALDVAVQNGATLAQIESTMRSMQDKSKTAVNEAANQIGLGIVGCAGGSCTAKQQNANSLRDLAAKAPNEYQAQFTESMVELSSLQKAGYIANELLGVGAAQADEANPNETGLTVEMNVSRHVTDDKNAFDTYQAAVASLDKAYAVANKAFEDAVVNNAPEATIDAAYDKALSITNQKRDIIESMFGVRADAVSFSTDKSKTDDTTTQTASAPNPQNTNTSPTPSNTTPQNNQGTPSQNPNTPGGNSSAPNTTPSATPQKSAPSSWSGSTNSGESRGAPEANVEKNNPNLVVPKPTVVSQIKSGAGAVIGTVGGVVRTITGVGPAKVEPRGIRNNNPGNIDQGQNFVGEIVSKDSRFAQFESPEFGIRAIYKVQKTYETKHGLTSVADRVARWAPPNENNTQAYINTVASKMGVSPTAPFTITDPVLGPAFVEAIVEVENSRNPYSIEQIKTGQDLAFGTDSQITTASVPTTSEVEDASSDTPEAQAKREAEARSQALQNAFDAYGDSREAARMSQEAVAKDIKDQLERRCVTCSNVTTVYSPVQDDFDVTFTDNADPKDSISFNSLPATAQAGYVQSTVGTLAMRKEVVAGRAFEIYEQTVVQGKNDQNASDNPSNATAGSIEDTAKYWSKNTFDSVIHNLSTKDFVNVTGYVNPITGTMDLGNTPQYGQDTRTGKNGAKTRDHAGVDLYAKTQSGRLTGPEALVNVALAGTVVRSQWQNGYGYTIDILGDDGKVQRYSHISGKNPDGKSVEVGQLYETGQALTTITGSGTMFGAKVNELGGLEAAESYFNKNGWGTVNKPHLHFEVREQSGFGFKGTIDPASMLPDVKKGNTFVAGDGTDSSLTTASTGQVDARKDFVDKIKDLRDKKFGNINGVQEDEHAHDEEESTAQNPQTDENLGPVDKPNDLKDRVKSVVDTVKNIFSPRIEPLDQNPNIDENLGPVSFVRNVQLTVLGGIKSIWNSIKNIFGDGEEVETYTNLYQRSESRADTASTTSLKARADGKYVVADIEGISVHFGLSIGCPDENGVARNGYIYTLKLRNKQASSERTGCGLETPYVYAIQIARDLEQNANFAPIDVEELLKKMKFIFYNGSE